MASNGLNSDSKAVLSDLKTYFLGAAINEVAYSNTAGKRLLPFVPYEKSRERIIFALDTLKKNKNLEYADGNRTMLKLTV